MKKKVLLISTLLFSSTLCLQSIYAEDNKQTATVDSICDTTNTLNSTEQSDDTNTTTSTETKDENEDKQKLDENGLPIITEENQHGMGDASKRLNIFLDPNGKSRAYGTPYISVNSTGKPRWDFIDVSSNNGHISVDLYKTMKKYGVKGVVVKLTEATSYRNPLAGEQIANAKKAGLHVTTYHFSHFSNKAQAIAEANYYANYAKELGVSKTPLMVNDFECNAHGEFSGATSNSKAFADRLSQLGFKNAYHYASASVFDNYLSPNSIGGSKMWVAGYPYEPSASNLMYSNRAAWQWTDNMHFPGSNVDFDANIDYTGYFTGRAGKPSFHKDPRYVTVMKDSYKTYSGLAPYKQKSTTKSMYHKTYLSKGYYNYKGECYYTLYDNKGNWQGYVNKKGVKSGDGKRGAHLSTSGFGFVSQKDYAAWKDINNFNSKVHQASTVYHKTYKIKGYYRSFEGQTYYSMYDDNGKWQGYINSNGIKRTNRRYGEAISSKNYGTVTVGNYTVWKDLQNFKDKKGTTSSLKDKTYFVKGYYNHVNGNRYLSLYDNKGNWQGYVDSKGVNVTNKRAGKAYSTKQYVVTKSDNYNIWTDLQYFKETNGLSKALKNKTYQVKYYYNHYNGHKYYSLYDNKGDWMGYIDAQGVETSTSK